jgi:hypothetical protein
MMRLLPFLVLGAARTTLLAVVKVSGRLPQNVSICRGYWELSKTCIDPGKRKLSAVLGILLSNDETPAFIRSGSTAVLARSESFGPKAETSRERRI